MRHPLSLLTREVAPVVLDRERTVLLLQDLHAPFADVTSGPLVREARRRGVAREFDEFVQMVPAAVANAARLLACARELGIAVHHVLLAHRVDEGSSAFAQAMGWEWRLGDDATIVRDVAPLPGEAVHVKPGWGALGSDDLRRALRDAGVASIVLAGLPFDFGIRQTCFELADAGYRTLLASDATAALTAAAEAPTRGNLSHGATKLRSTDETLELLARVPHEGRVWV